MQVLTHFNSQRGDSIIYNGKCAPDTDTSFSQKTGRKIPTEFNRGVISTSQLFNGSRG